jgi:hypothetical protein
MELIEDWGVDTSQLIMRACYRERHIVMEDSRRLPSQDRP